MKMSCNLLLVALAGFSLLGCGGTGAKLLPDRGEGSIPIGRAQAADARDTSVSLRIGEWQQELSPAANGLVYAPSSLPNGDWLVQVSRDGFYSESFQVSPTADKTEQFDVTLLRSSGRPDVTGVTLDHPSGIQIRVGENLKLKTIVTGTNVNGIKVSYWTSGGVGSMTPGGVFKAKAAGTGTVTADAYGLSSTVAVTVLP